MKTLTVLASTIGATVHLLRFRHAGNGNYKRGYCIVDKDNNELVTIEPIYHTNGARWMVTNHSVKDSGIKYIRRLTQLKKLQIQAGRTGYIFKPQ